MARTPRATRPGRGPDRRTVLKAAGLGAFGLASAGALTRFGTDNAYQDPGECRAADLSTTERDLVVSNWPGYIDPMRNPEGTLATFEAATGISVSYTNDVNDNAEFFARIQNQMGACETVERDMFVLTDWCAARTIGLGWIQPLDRDAVPNLHANLIDPLRGRQWDPDRTYSAPWQSGLTGIAYNAAEVPEVGSFSDLVTRSDLRGRITLLSEMRDTMAFFLRIVGADPDDFTDAQWSDAVASIEDVVASGQVRAFTGNEYLGDLEAGNIVACEAWSGDVIQAQFENPDIRFVVPEEGLSLWSDNMLVPNLATHQANAEAWIDYYYEPEVAARLAAWVNYICPVQGAEEQMEKIDPSLVGNRLIFPTADDLADTFDFMALDEAQTRTYEGDWNDVTGG